jgi:hypothetical protein
MTVRSGAQVPLRMTVAGLAVLALLAPVAAIVGGLVAGRAGVWGGLLGAALPALVLGVTLVAVWLTRNASATTLAAAVFGSYLVKLVLLLIVLAALREADFYDRPVLGVTALLGLILALVVEALAVVRANAPYVEPVPSARPAAGDGPAQPGRR